MSLNRTGTYDTTELLLGRGILYVTDLDADTGLPATGAWFDMGAISEMNETITTEKFEHFNSRTGFKTKDVSVVSSREMAVSFQIESLGAQNLARFLIGTSTGGVTNGAVAGFTEYTMITNVEKGRWYDIVNSSGVRCYNITPGNLTVEKSGAPDTALVLDTDYTLDAEMGRIFILTTGVVLMSGVDEVDVTLTAAAGAGTVDTVSSLTAASGFVALKFIGENPLDSSQRQERLYHKVALAPNGDLGLISDEAAKMGFEGVVQQSNATAHASNPYSLVTDLTPA